MCVLNIAIIISVPFISVNKYDDGTFAIFTCLRKDKNFRDDNNMFQKNDVEEKLLCITSGALTSVEKYKMVSGYDINFFIDYVDYDLCYQFRELGYKILRINFIGILHEAGKGRNAKFFFNDIIIYNHAPIRTFYMSRNIIYMYKKHKKLYSFISLILDEIKLLLKIIFYEQEKFMKIKYWCMGILRSNFYEY